MAIHIAQLMCPKRHCIIAILYPIEEFTDEEGALMVQVQYDDWLESKTLNPWCGLCYSKEFHIETGRTKYQTMQEAMPHVKEEEIKQMLTALHFKTHPQRN